jgi:mono/diheme cytochrome c family protein
MRPPGRGWNDRGVEPSIVPDAEQSPAGESPSRRRHPVLRWTLRIGLAAVALVALAQLVPYGRSHTNPPVKAEPQWSSPQTRALAVKACFDCHSNETTWPWYSNVAPVSWLVQSDVSGGRSALNFSDWNRAHEGAGDVIEAVSGGSMPPWYYTIEHPEAKLSATEKQALMAGLAATLRNSPPVGGG